MVQHSKLKIHYSNVTVNRSDLLVCQGPVRNWPTSPHLSQHVLQVPAPHWMHEPWYLYDRAAAKVLSQLLLVPCGTHEDNSEVRVLLQAGAQQSQKQVCVNIPLVNLVHHHVADSLQ